MHGDVRPAATSRTPRLFGSATTGTPTARWPPSWAARPASPQPGTWAGRVRPAAGLGCERPTRGGGIRPCPRAAPETLALETTREPQTEARTRPAGAGVPHVRHPHLGRQDRGSAPAAPRRTADLDEVRGGRGTSQRYEDGGASPWPVGLMMPRTERAVSASPRYITASPGVYVPWGQPGCTPSCQGRGSGRGAGLGAEAAIGAGATSLAVIPANDRPLADGGGGRSPRTG